MNTPIKKIARVMVLCFGLNTAVFARTQLQGLAAKGPAPEAADKLMLFGQFVDDWEFDMIMFHPDGTKQFGKGQWHFAWVLQGHAIQDVWIACDDVSKPNAPLSEYGTTLRFYDSTRDAWRVVWAGPMRHSLITFVAQKVGDEIVMEADHRGGSQERGRWIFYDIRPQSFRWRAVKSSDAGKTWITTQEMNVRRVNGAQNEPSAARVVNP